MAVRSTAARASAVCAGMAAGFGVSYVVTRRRGDEAPPVCSALQPGQTLRCALQSVEPLSRDTSRYRFGLPSEKHVLGVPTASHILAVDRGNMFREYTPVTLDAEDEGYFDLVVKRYENGYFSEQFHRLAVGETMDFRGPVVTLKYEANSVARLSMVCGGTGITPMFQIIRTVLRDPSDATKIALLYANRSPEDILLRNELDGLARAHPDRFEVTYVVDAAAPDDRVPEENVGRIDAAKIARALPPADAHRTALLVCGPKGLMDFLCGPKPPKAAHNAPVGGLLGRLGFGRGVVRFD